MTRPDVDYAQTAVAQRNREVKAARLVRAVEQLGLSIADLDMAAGRRQEIRRHAGVDRTSEDTWYMVEETLRARGHTAPEPVEQEPAAAAPALVEPVQAAPEPVAGPPAPTPAPLVVEPPAARPTRVLACCWSTGCPTTGPTVHPYPGGPFCDQHAPWAIAGHTRTPPPPGTTLAERMAAAGRRPGGPARSSTVVDDRAIVSGKRRSTPAAYRDALTRRGEVIPDG